MTTNLNDLEIQLKKYVTGELKSFSGRFSNNSMAQFDLGCYPWHGTFEISFLTTDEPNLTDKKNVAAWRLYNFTSTFTTQWPATKEIGSWMRELYEKKTHSVQDFLDMCVRVIQSDEVMDTLQKEYKLAPDFTVSVFDPDNPKKGNLCK